jgi:diguanylate cyclase (GGDEF)-like protein
MINDDAGEAAAPARPGRGPHGPIPTALVVISMVLAAAFIVPLLLLEPLPPIEWWPLVAAVSALLLWWGERQRNPVGRGSQAQVTFSAASAVITAVTLLVPPWILPVVFLAYSVARTWRLAVVNYALLIGPQTAAIVAMSAVGLLWRNDSLEPSEFIVLALVAGVVQFFVSGFLITLLVMWSEGIRFRESPVWDRDRSAILLSQISLGTVAATLLRTSWWYLPLVVLVVWWAFRYWRLELRAVTADGSGFGRVVRLDVLREAVHYEQGRSLETGRPLALVLLDIDELRAVNETLGEAAGDAVLKAVGERITAGGHYSEVHARTGPDEFTVLLLDLGPDEVLSRTQRMVDAVGAAPIATPAGDASVTVCAGVIRLAPDEPLDDALARLDRTLYEAKGEGPASLAIAP